MRRRTLLALAPLVLTTVGCSAFEQAAPPEEALETARTHFEEAGSVKFDLKHSAIPEGRNGVSAANGTGVVDKDEPKFQGQVTGVIKGNSAGVEIIAVGDKTWMSFFTKDFNPVDMKDLGAPNPANFFMPGSGVGKVLADTERAEEGDKRRQGKVVLQTYTGTIPAATIEELFLLGEEADAFDVTYGIEPESGELREAEISGEFYEGSTTTFTLKITDYGTPADISSPD